jgi:hypothetical protein
VDTVERVAVRNRFDMADRHPEHSLTALADKTLGSRGCLGIVESDVSFFRWHAPLPCNCRTSKVEVPCVGFATIDQMTL